MVSIRIIRPQQPVLAAAHRFALRFLYHEILLVDPFDAFGFLIRQFPELLLPRASGKPATVLVQETKQKVYRAIGHVDEVFDVLLEFIVPTEKLCLRRQVMLNGFLDTGVKEFGVRRGIEETVEVTGVSQNEYKPNKAPFCWLLPAPHRRRYLPAAFTAAH